MSYFSNIEELSLGSWLGCGPDCSCGPRRSGMHGFSQRYEKDEPDEVPADAGPKPQSLNGWHSLGFYRFHDGDQPPTETTAPTQPPSEPPPQEGPTAETRPAEPPVQEKPPVRPEISPEADRQLIQEAIRRGIRGPRQLTDIVFFARHPSRKGTPIWANEVELMEERRQIRETLVAPALRQMFGLRLRPVFRRGFRPGRFRRFAGIGFAGVPAPVCAAARSDLGAVAADITLINNELAKGAGGSAHRLDLKKRLLESDVDGMISALDSYIVSGCCEPALKTLESEVKALPWHVSVVPTQLRLLREIVAAQGRARKDFKHC